MIGAVVELDARDTRGGGKEQQGFVLKVAP